MIKTCSWWDSQSLTNDEDDLNKILKLSKDKMGIKLKGVDIEGFQRYGP